MTRYWVTTGSTNPENGYDSRGVIGLFGLLKLSWWALRTPLSVRGHGDRLEDVFAETITLVDSDELRALKQEVLGNA